MKWGLEEGVHDPISEPYDLPLQPLRVGLRAPDEVAGKVAYALEELLTAAGIPHGIVRTDTAEGWDLFYGACRPRDGGLWMAASPQAWQFFAEPGLRVEAVCTARVAGRWLRLPHWNIRSDALAEVHAAASLGYPPLPDLASAAFFFLARWEEWQSTERDSFGRFPLSASVFGRGLWFMTECPVEAYAWALRRTLEERMGDRYSVFGVRCSDPAQHRTPNTEYRTPAFVLGLSHDIDSVRRWDTRGCARTGREALRALLRGQVRKATRETGDLVAGLRTRLNGRDPHLNLNEIVRIEREAAASSTFFLLARHTHPWDGTHAPHYQRLLPSLARTLAAEAEIGLHAGTAAIDAASIAEERGRLAALSGETVRGVRFHNLRGGYGALPGAAAAGFSYDSSLAFAEEPGFPAGLARPFRPYDRGQDRPLDLIEIPLAVMDTTLLSGRYLGLKIRSGRQRALLTVDAVRRWGGAAALLWHNDNLPPNDADGYAAFYTELIEWTRAAGGRVSSLGEIAEDWKRARAPLRRRG